MKPPKRPNQQAMLDDFNARFPIGTAVTYHRLMHHLRDPMPTKTRSEAWLRADTPRWCSSMA
jgi:hypothetical protein